MRPNNIAWFKRLLHCGVEFDVVKLEATVSMEIDRRDLLDVSDDSPGTSHLLLQGHCWSYLM